MQNGIPLECLEYEVTYLLNGVANGDALRIEEIITFSEDYSSFTIDPVKLDAMLIIGTFDI